MIQVLLSVFFLRWLPILALIGYFVYYFVSKKPGSVTGVLSSWWTKYKEHIVLAFGYYLFINAFIEIAEYWYLWTLEHVPLLLLGILAVIAVSVVLGLPLAKKEWSKRPEVMYLQFLTTLLGFFILGNSIVYLFNKEDNPLRWGYTYGERTVAKTIKIPESAFVVDYMTPVVGTGKEISIGVVPANHRFIIENYNVEYTLRYPGGTPEGWSYVHPTDVTFAASREIFLTVPRGQQIMYKIF